MSQNGVCYEVVKPAWRLLRDTTQVLETHWQRQHSDSKR